MTIMTRMTNISIDCVLKEKKKRKKEKIRIGKRCHCCHYKIANKNAGPSMGACGEGRAKRISSVIVKFEKACQCQ